MDNTNQNPAHRTLAPQPYGIRVFSDQAEAVSEYCKTGRSSAEVLRDLIDEAIQARRNPPVPIAEIMQALQQSLELNRQAIERCEQLIEKYETFAARSIRVKETLTRNLREFYLIVTEALIASLGARNLVWSFIAAPLLKHKGQVDAQIQARDTAEKEAATAQSNELADAIEKRVREAALPQ